MRMPRRHRFRMPAGPGELFHRLPSGRRFRFAQAADGWTCFGHDPVHVVSADPCLVDEEPPEGRSGSGVLLADRLREALPRVPPPRAGSLRFPGGAVGWVTWERGVRAEGLSPRHVEPGRPELWFGVYDTFATWDPDTREVEVVSWGLRPGEGFDPRLALQRAGELEERLRGDPGTPPPDAEPRAIRRVGPPVSPDACTPPSLLPPRLSLDRAAHSVAVNEILEAIRRGDVYQADLTVRFDVPTRDDAATIFDRLLTSNPAPYSALIETDRGSVISSSPERLLAVSDRRLETRPIKGTIPRSADPAEDRALAAELLASAKDRAELLMITDLLRNDLGKVSDYGTVRCPDLRRLESFPHVHHLVSTVEGRLRSGLDVFDAIAAVFPGGSIAGAPKRRAIQLLAELEPSPRGVYTGTVGWIGFDRTADLSVAIRTGILAEGVFSFGAGGGIVADSTPDAEWRELHWKARAILRALGAAEDETVRPGVDELTRGIEA